MVKKLLAVLLAAVMVLSLAACTKKAEETTAAAPETTTEAASETEAPETTAAPETEAPTEKEDAETAAPETEAPTEKTETEAPSENVSETPAEGVMSYDEYMAAAVDDEVTIEAYFQAAQSWWDNKATLYLQDKDGGYFVYNASCTEEQYNTLQPGVKVLVTGYKAEWAGEIEIADAAFEVVDDGDTYIAAAADVTSLLGSADLVAHQNQLVAFSGMTVEAYDESGAAFAYKDPDKKTDDLYFKVSKDGETYEFCVEYYLTNEETDVYKAVEQLQVGDVVDLEGFLYWYEGANPHITSVKPAGASESSDVMSYADYMAAEMDSEVTVEAYVQATQSWWDNKVKIYAQDADGGYFIYDAACTEEQNAELVPGVKIRVNGYKAEWAGEVEIADATFEVLADEEPFLAEPVDVTEFLGKDEIGAYQNQLVKFTELTVEDYGDGNAFAYKNAEEKTDDLYFKVSKDGETYEFCVEYYLCNEETDVYKAVEQLQIGDVIDVEGFLYWYEGINPHVTSVTVK